MIPSTTSPTVPEYAVQYGPYTIWSANRPTRRDTNIDWGNTAPPYAYTTGDTITIRCDVGATAAVGGNTLKVDPKSLKLGLARHMSRMALEDARDDERSAPPLRRPIEALRPPGAVRGRLRAKARVCSGSSRYRVMFR
jgi:hypothetical protein